MKVAVWFTYRKSNATCDNRYRGSNYAFFLLFDLNFNWSEISTIRYPDLQNERTVLINSYICLNCAFSIFPGVFSIQMSRNGNFWSDGWSFWLHGQVIRWIFDYHGGQQIWWMSEPTWQQSRRSALCSSNIYQRENVCIKCSMTTWKIDVCHNENCNDLTLSGWVSIILWGINSNLNNIQKVDAEK